MVGRRGLEHKDVRPGLLALAEADVAQPAERMLDQLLDVVLGMLACEGSHAHGARSDGPGSVAYGMKSA